MGTMCDNFIISEDNQNEFKIWQGLVGAHYTPYVDGVGNLSWTNNGGLPNPPTVNVSGKGLDITGIVATSGDLPATANQFDTYLVGTQEPYYVYMYYNGSWVNIGAVGKGEQGEPGFSPVVTVSPITGGHQISITDAEDTETFNVMDGADGQDGVGVPTGGTTGQVLAKASGSNYDTEWVNQSGGADPATVAPLMDGTAAVGTSTKYAREDHVHPTDTSRASASDMTTAQGNITSLQTSVSGITPHKESITIAYASWSGSDPYTQTVTISGATITSNTKVDIQPDATALAQLISDGISALYIVNNSGVLTLYAIGAATTADITVQVTYYETT